MKEKYRDLLDRFLRMGALLHRYHIQNFRNFGPFSNPLRGQGRVLSILKMQPEISQKELAYLLNMRNQSLGELLSKLERSGYVTRTPSEDDRRLMMVKLTPEGAQAADKSGRKDIGESSIFSCLKEDELDNLCDYLGRLIECLEKSLAEGESEESERHRPPYGSMPFEREDDMSNAPHFMPPPNIPPFMWYVQPHFRSHGKSPKPPRFGCRRKTPEEPTE